MAQLLPLQKYEATDYNGLVTDNHFHALYQQKPQLISKVIKHIYKTNLSGKLREFVDRFPIKEVEQENGFYQWMLKGQEEKNIPLMDAQTLDGRSISGGDFPASVGANRERFYLIFGEGLFENTNVLKGETDDFHFLVKQSTEDGGRFLYEVELYNSNERIAVPIQELTRGMRFSKFYGATPSTLSYQGSKPFFTSPWRMENRLSQMRMEYEVPGNVIEKGDNEPLEFGFSAKGGDIQEKVWINYQDMVAHHQFEEMFARMEVFGKRNWTNDHKYLNFDDKTKFAIESGSGLIEQIAPSNRHLFNTYDLDWHMEMVLDMAIGKMTRDKRHVHIMTGEWGSINISKQIEAKGSSKWTVISDNMVYNKTNSGNTGSSNTLGYGYQFNEYQYYNGIRLTVEILDFLDNDVYFPRRHPDGEGITESHRMLTMGFGGEAGIYRTKAKSFKETIWRYSPGMRDPYSAGGAIGNKNSIAVSKSDGYEVNFMKSGGIMVEEPTKIIDMQMNVTNF
jgi:hypothetical protein